MHVTQQIWQQVEDKATSHLMWKTLLEIHEKPDFGTTHWLYKQLMTTEWDGTSPIQDHIAELWNISCCLRAASAAPDVKLEASALLASLPDTPH